MSSSDRATGSQQLNHLIRMLNQISANHQHHDDIQQAASAVANHVRKFWARTMKERLINCSEEDRARLSPTALRSIALLIESAPPATAAEGRGKRPPGAA